MGCAVCERFLLQPGVCQLRTCPALSCRRNAALPLPPGRRAERSNVAGLKEQLGVVKEAVAKEQELSEKIRREAMSAAASAARQVRCRAGAR